MTLNLPVGSGHSMPRRSRPRPTSEYRDSDPALVATDLLDVTDAKTIAVLERANQSAGFVERFVRARVEPRRGAREHLDAQLTAFEVGVVQCGDLEFAA